MSDRKALVVVDARHWRSSGIGRVTRNLVPALVERLQASGLHAICLVPPGVTAADTGCEIVVSTASMYSARELLSLGRYIDSLQPNAYLALHFSIPLLLRSPLFVMIHDDLPATGILGRKSKYVARALLGSVRRRAVHTFAVSAFTRGQLVLRYGFEPCRTSVASPALDHSWPRVASLRPSNHYVVVGNIKRHKNIEAAIEAIRVLRDGGLDVRLEAFGQGFGDRASDSAISKNAAWISHRSDASDEQISGSMVNAIALIQPSVYEGFGLPPLEAMALGCPVVASLGGSLPEVCGDAALFFDPYNTQQLVTRLQELQSDSALRARMIERGRQRAASYSWEATADRIASTIERATGQGPRA